MIDYDTFAVNNTVLTPGSIVTLAVIYSTTDYIAGSKSISITVDGVPQSNSGFTTMVQDLNIPLDSGGTNLVVVAQAWNGNTEIGAPHTFTVPISELVDSTFYYGVGAQAANAATIQAMTKVLGPKETKTFVFTTSNQVQYFAYPIHYGYLTKILDTNGFNITSGFTTSVKSFQLTPPNFDGGVSDYIVYEFATLNSQSNFEITFKF